MYNTLMRMYPEAVEGDFELMDDGDGIVYINTWNEEKLGPVPSYESINALKPQSDKITMLERTDIHINDANREENLKDFPHLVGETLYNFVSDKDSIQAVQNQCLVMLDADPIPVGGGMWKTADTEADEVTPVFVSMNVAEFKAFATEYFNRGANNFAVKETHKANVRAMFLSDDHTAEDMWNYDFSEGWF